MNDFTNQETAFRNYLVGTTFPFFILTMLGLHVFSFVLFFPTKAKSTSCLAFAVVGVGAGKLRKEDWGQVRAARPGGGVWGSGETLGQGQAYSGVGVGVARSPQDGSRDWG